MDDLIPCLIDDLGRECLARIPFQSLPTATAVSKLWNVDINSPEFRCRRKLTGIARPVFVLTQANVDDPSHNLGSGLKQQPTLPAYCLSLFDLEMGSWVRLPRIPWLLDGLRMFCGVVGTGSDLVVIGGLDPVTCAASNSVYVYNFLSGKWRQGPDLPGIKRSFFGYGSDSNHKVLVAGGHDEEKNALKSAFLYDVAEDKWVPIADMARERDECKVIFHCGKFHVISGYPTYAQGWFERSMEVLDPTTLTWDPVIEEFLDVGASSGSNVASQDGRIYVCQNADVAVRHGNKWHVVAKIPADVRSSQWVGTCENKLMVIGSSNFGEPHNGYVLDLRNYKWNKIDVPKEYSGHVQSGCILEL